MSLATRCTACGTVFRVVQDQLKISEGWVRCGRCKEVFNALEGLFDLQREAPPEWKPAPQAETAAPSAAPTEDLPAPGTLLSASAEPIATAPALPEATDAEAPPGAIDIPLEPAAAAPADIDSEPRDSRDFADARFNTELAFEDEAAETHATEAAAAASLEAPAVVADAPQDEGEPPAFLREAAAAERWRRPHVRLALGATALLLALALGAQWALHFRDTVAARWPATRPTLMAACAALGCRIEVPRRIEDIAVESSALTRASGQGDALRLVVALRNRGPLSLALPHVELSLTDVNGELIARRALAAADFPAAGASLPAAGETTLRTLLADPGGRVAGYTVEVFYP
jgi:predicted Zn finger-like uncharacterized protein